MKQFVCLAAESELPDVLGTLSAYYQNAVVAQFQLRENIPGNASFLPLKLENHILLRDSGFYKFLFGFNRNLLDPLCILL